MKRSRAIHEGLDRALRLAQRTIGNPPDRDPVRPTTCNHFPGQTACDWCRAEDELARRFLDSRNSPPGHAAFREPTLPASEWRNAYFALARIAIEQLNDCRERLERTNR